MNLTKTNTLLKTNSFISQNKKTKIELSHIAFYYILYFSNFNREFYLLTMIFQVLLLDIFVTCINSIIKKKKYVVMKIQFLFLSLSALHCDLANLLHLDNTNKL